MPLRLKADGSSISVSGRCWRLQPLDITGLTLARTLENSREGHRLCDAVMGNWTKVHGPVPSGVLSGRNPNVREADNSVYPECGVPREQHR